MKQQLKKYLNRYVSFKDVEIDAIYKLMSIEVFNKKEFLLKQDKICNQRFFITEGIVRYFRTDEKGNENIGYFGLENWWITNIDSFINGTPSYNAIQAIEPTTVLALSKKDMEVLYIEIPKLERAFRIITENMLIAVQRKDEIYMKISSKERYYSLISEVPSFAQRVPQYMIASYLDISPEYLSEIRKKK